MSLLLFFVLLLLLPPLLLSEETGLLLKILHLRFHHKWLHLHLQRHFHLKSFIYKFAFACCS